MAYLKYASACHPFRERLLLFPITLFILWACPLAAFAQHTVPLPGTSATKLAPILREETGATTGSYRVQVRDRAAFEDCLRAIGLQVNISATAEQPHILYLRAVSREQLKELAACGSVTYIDRGNRRAVAEADLRDADLSANHIPAVHAQYPELTGQGLVASVKEEPFDPLDLDLRGRTLPVAEPAVGYSTHATAMATYIAGAGNSGPTGLGVASYASLASSRYAELMPDATQQLLEESISVQNHSYGVGVENYYGLEAQAYDAQVFENPWLLHVFSSGNSGEEAASIGNKYTGIPAFANLTGQFKVSKNTLCVGALDPDGRVGSRSSRGPAYDGRVKPELVAHGKGGTSEAAAVVSGIALLVQQAYQEQYGGKLPPASLVKAILINSADDVGRPHVDFEAGYGNADALGAIQTVLKGQYLTESIAQGQEKRFPIDVPAGVSQLKVTVVWHDPAADAEAGQALLHDLDLTLHHPASGQTWQPWVLNAFPHPDSLRQPARRGKDRLNNTEQVTLKIPAPGVYELWVQGYRVGEDMQSFSLAYEYETAGQWRYPVRGSSLHAGKLHKIRWQTGQRGSARLEYRFAGSAEWHLMNDEVEAGTSVYEWIAPDTVAMVQLRLRTEKDVLESETFLLSRELPLQVGLACPGQVLVHWPKLDAAAQYQVYTLGTKHLEPLTLISDTMLVLGEEQLQKFTSGYLTVAPIIQGQEGEKSIAINYNASGLGCYIAQFLAARPVMDSVALDLQLTTTYGLASLTLERWEAGAFQTISSLSQVNRLTYYLQDPTPKPGKNVYRVKVTNQEGVSFYSQPEEVVHAGADFMLVYPNPVEAGQSLFVAINSDAAEVELFDPMGRLLYRGREEGMIKEIAALRLQPGLHVLRVRTASGQVLARRVLVR